MSQVLDWLTIGSAMGAVYGLIALSLVLVFRSSGVLNLAQGEFAMLGAVIAVSLEPRLGLLAAALVSIILVSFLAAVIEAALLRPFADRKPMSLILITLGVAFTLAAGAGYWFGVDARYFNGWEGTFEIAGSRVSKHGLLTIVIVLATTVALGALLARSRIGQQFRAICDDQFSAVLVGINVSRVKRVAFVVAAAVSALAGVLATPILTASYEMGFSMTVKGFTAAVLGTFGSIRGALIGGLALGLVESFSTGLFGSTFRDILGLLILLGILIWRPKGVLRSGVASARSI